MELRVRFIIRPLLLDIDTPVQFSRGGLINIQLMFPLKASVAGAFFQTTNSGPVQSATNACRGISKSNQDHHLPCIHTIHSLFPPSTDPELASHRTRSGSDLSDCFVTSVPASGLDGFVEHVTPVAVCIVNSVDCCDQRGY